MFSVTTLTNQQEMAMAADLILIVR